MYFAFVYCAPSHHCRFYFSLKICVCIYVRIHVFCKNITQYNNNNITCIYNDPPAFRLCNFTTRTRSYNTGGGGGIDRHGAHGSFDKWHAGDGACVSESVTDGLTKPRKASVCLCFLRILPCHPFFLVYGIPLKTTSIVFVLSMSGLQRMGSFPNFSSFTLFVLRLHFSACVWVLVFMYVIRWVCAWSFPRHYRHVGLLVCKLFSRFVVNERTSCV